MAHYRAYLLDHNDRIICGIDIEASDDADACLRAGTGLDGLTMIEVWCGARRVQQTAKKTAGRGNNGPAEGG
jgi:hypothetical protein